MKELEREAEKREDKLEGELEKKEAVKELKREMERTREKHQRPSRGDGRIAEQKYQMRKPAARGPTPLGSQQHLPVR